MMNDVNIQLVGDDNLLKAFRELDYRTQQKTLHRVVRHAARPMVKELQRNSPRGSSVRGTNFSVLATGNLRRSMGIVRGKSKKSAIIFVGPRMAGSGKKTNRRDHSGWVANILEFGKGERRRPTKGQFLKTPWGPRKSVAGVKRQAFVIPSLMRTKDTVGKDMIKSLRVIIERSWKKYSK